MKSLLLGTHGVISVSANVSPNTHSKICAAVRNGELEKAKKINDINTNLYRLMFVESNPIPVKWAPYISLMLLQGVANRGKEWCNGISSAVAHYFRLGYCLQLKLSNNVLNNDNGTKCILFISKIVLKGKLESKKVMQQC